jgi:ABC-type phosphate transport system substrate-binding protein
MEMRLASRLLTIGTALVLAASAAAVPGGTALADPPSGVVPSAGDAVGVGADTMQYLLDQLAQDYDTTHPDATRFLYSWDETNPDTGLPGGQIVTKAGCPAIARPDGSSAGIAALEANVTDPSDPNDHCVDYAGSSRGPTANDPACAPGGICFIRLADDAVTWASRDAASGGTDAPASLTLTQLKDIYLCKITNWAGVGGVNAPIEPFLPQASAGITTFWLTALGGGTTPITPGGCVSDDGNQLQDNEGVNPVLDSPEAIVPYSVGDYIAQAYHSAACQNPSCSTSPPCAPAGSQNQFGCDLHGVLGLNEIGGRPPMLPWPPGSPCPACEINPKFGSLFQDTLYVVVRYASDSAYDPIPSYLVGLFAPDPHGYVCTSPTAKRDIVAYGFEPLAGYSDASGGCGTPHGPG